jgi:hypothetical protein
MAVGEYLYAALFLVGAREHRVRLQARPLVAVFLHLLQCVRVAVVPSCAERGAGEDAVRSSAPVY